MSVKQTMVYPCNGILLSHKKQHVRVSKDITLKEANLQMLYPLWFYVGDILEEATLKGQRSDHCLPGAAVGWSFDYEEAALGEFLGDLTAVSWLWR